MAWNLYDLFRKKQAGGIAGAIDLTAVTVKCALVTNTEVPDQNLDDFWNDASANEVSGTNYTAGGNAVGTVTVTMDGAGVVTIDGDDPATWLQNASGFSNARRAILYRDTGVASTSELIAFSDAFAADKGNVDGDFSITLDAAGIFTAAR